MDHVFVMNRTTLFWTMDNAYVIKQPISSSKMDNVFVILLLISNSKIISVFAIILFIISGIKNPTPVINVVSKTARNVQPYENVQFVNLDFLCPYRLVNVKNKFYL